jgi:hypothetical protein
MSDTDKRSEQFIEVKEASLTEAARTDNDPFYVSPEDSRRVLRKTDLNMMPVLCAIIALQFVSSEKHAKPSTGQHADISSSTRQP